MIGYPLGWDLSISLLREDENHILLLTSFTYNGFFFFGMCGNMQVADQFYDILHKHCEKVQVCFR